MVIVNDVSFETLKALVAFMYRGEAFVSSEDLGSFLQAAKDLGIKGDFL